MPDLASQRSGLRPLAARDASTGAVSHAHRPHFGRFLGHSHGRSALHRIENADGQSLHDIKGELRDATRAALWQADSREEAGVTVGNAIRDVLVDNGFEVDEVMDAIESRGFGRHGRGFGPFGLGALRHADPVQTEPVDGVPPAAEPPADEPATTTVATVVVVSAVQTVEASGTEPADSDDEVDDDDASPGSRFELEFELTIETPTTKLELKLELSKPLPEPGSDDGFEAARTILEAFLAKLAPGSLVSTTA